ncbi:MAG: hypothetical protein CVT63_07025 [Candidatus Anoxymicrobium japonicum]|uniref:DUF6788 domain-containing protein n=1 Tax=Candidatus Anoxymicrobium japonicum TaxID=2013648 RepID=A0A2N3G4S5_9ACTN|nr:MAG: hypothetical protein CVT63_07025 [Candidatus Anoxymicrobium japonicum]
MEVETVVEKERKKKEDMVLRGSLYTMRRKCGKENCRCVDGDPHETQALSYWARGKPKLLTLRPEDVPVVKTGIERYRKQKAELDKRAERDIATLRAEIQRRKGRRGRA